jgi:hypothetical protein
MKRAGSRKQAQRPPTATPFWQPHYRLVGNLAQVKTKLGLARF